jgi:hypothetical protein
MMFWLLFRLGDIVAGGGGADFGPFVRRNRPRRTIAFRRR